MIDACGLADRGDAKSLQDDCLGIDLSLRLFVVADAQGSFADSPKPSQLAVEAVLDSLRRSSDGHCYYWPYGINPALSHDGNRLRTAIHLAHGRLNRAVHSHQADNDPALATAMAGVLLSGSRLVTGHAGQIRAYLLSHDQLEELTHDNFSTSWTRSRDDDAQTARCYGVHLSERELSGGETILLCTKGLHKTLDPQSIFCVMREDTNIAGIARRLIDAARGRGCRDDIMTVVVKYGK